MKTLDEVIKAIEVCADYSEDCQHCPYENEGGLECVAKYHDDLLHYLKEYKRISARLEKIALGNIMETLEKLDNPPLTWEELKQMEGKPVWVEWLLGYWEDKKKWVIVGKVFENYLTFAATDIVQGYGGTLYKCHVGEVWQAYRKERK